MVISESARSNTAHLPAETGYLRTPARGGLKLAGHRGRSRSRPALRRSRPSPAICCYAAIAPERQNSLFGGQWAGGQFCNSQRPAKTG